jgi:hypothetical protein
VAESHSRDEADPPARDKKPYAAPKLTEYGSVSKLTMAKGTTIFEAPGQLKRGPCL